MNNPMKPDDFVFVDYEGKLLVCSKSRWNAKNGYISDDYQATQEALAFLKTLSSEFNDTGECRFVLGSTRRFKEAKKLLQNAGVVCGSFGVKV